jgi:prolyl 4-hydroxylase
MMQHNPYDLIIIKQNVIPHVDIEELMLLTNNKEQISQATIFNTDKEGKTTVLENLKNRNTLWYEIPEEQGNKLQVAISQCYTRFCVPKYHCEFKNYEPAQFLGYPVGGHYIEHNDAENFNNGKWTRIAERDVSFLFYLNGEFGGGELEFPELGLTIKPKKGMMIAFPSYREFVHKVHPVTWGHRYTLVSWVGTKQKLYDTIPTEGV